MASAGARVLLLRDSLKVFFADASVPGATTLASLAVRVLLLRDSLKVFFVGAAPGVTVLASPGVRAVLLRDSKKLLLPEVSVPVAVVAGCDCASDTTDMHNMAPATTRCVVDMVVAVSTPDTRRRS